MFASQMVMAGIDLVTVSEILGHASIKMTMRYAHLSPVHKREAMEILGSRIRSQIKAEDSHQMDTKVPYEILPIPNRADLPSKEGWPSG